MNVSSDHEQRLYNQSYWFGNIFEKSRAITNQSVSSVEYKYSYDLDVIENEFLDSYTISTFCPNIYLGLSDGRF